MLLVSSVCEFFVCLFIWSHFSVSLPLLKCCLYFLLSYDLSRREMWQVALCIRFSFAPCSDRIHVAVTDMAALFPNVSFWHDMNVTSVCEQSLWTWTVFIFQLSIFILKLPGKPPDKQFIPTSHLPLTPPPLPSHENEAMYFSAKLQKSWKLNNNNNKKKKK